MRARRRPLAGQIKEYQTNPFFRPARTKYNHLHHPATNPYTNPGNPGKDPPVRAAEEARVGGAPSVPRSVPNLAPSRRWLVSWRKLPPEPCNRLASAGKKN